jgi:hypothetical protein
MIYYEITRNGIPGTCEDVIVFFLRYHIGIYLEQLGGGGDLADVRNLKQVTVARRPRPSSSS